MSVGTGIDSGPRQSPERVGQWTGPRHGNKAQHDFNKVLRHQLGERSLSVCASVSSFKTTSFVL